MTATPILILSGIRSRRLVEAAEIAKLSRLIWQGRMAGRDVSRLVELRALHKEAHAKFHGKEVEIRALVADRQRVDARQAAE